MKLRRSTIIFSLLLGLLWLPGQRASAAVGLFNFRAVSVSDGINLSWETGFEDNNLGFNLFRADRNDRSAATQVNPNLIPSQSQGGSGASYDYLDITVAPNILYYYWVETVGDILAEPVPPASATWVMGGGIVTNTPAPTRTPTATYTPSPVPTNAGPDNPGVSPTAGLNATSTPRPTRRVTPSPTAAAATGGSSFQVTSTAPAAGGAARTEATASPMVSDVGSETLAQTDSSAEAAAVPIVEQSEQIAVLQPTTDAAGSSESPASVAAPAGQEAQSIGAGTDSGATTLTGSVVEREGQGLSTGILMLLLAGGVFLFGGGATAFILLRQNSGQNKNG